MNNPIPNPTPTRRRPFRVLGATLFTLTLIGSGVPAASADDGGDRNRARTRERAEKPTRRSDGDGRNGPRVEHRAPPRVEHRAPPRVERPTVRPVPQAPAPRQLDRTRRVVPTLPGYRADRGSSAREGNRNGPGDDHADRSGDPRWRGGDDRSRGDRDGDRSRGDRDGDRSRDDSWRDRDDRWRGDRGRDDESHSHRGYRGHGQYDRDDRWSRDRGGWSGHSSQRRYRPRYYDPYRTYGSRFYRDVWGFDHDPFNCSHNHSGYYDSFRSFRLPQLIYRTQIHSYEPYYYDRVWYPSHGHHHVIYRFPIWDEGEYYYRPYAYCGDRLYATGWFDESGPQFDVSLGFSFGF